jgi:flagellar assembly protein FliH
MSSLDATAGATPWRFMPLEGSAQVSSAPPEEPYLTGRELAERALRDSYQRGLVEGLRTGSEQATRNSDAHNSRVDQLIVSMQEQYAALDTAVADAILGLAFSLAKQVIRSELTLRPELINTVIRDAMTSFSSRVAYPTISMHPDDIELIAPKLADELSIRGCRVLPDTSIARGGARIDSDSLQIDATLEARWQQVVLNLGRTPHELADVATN